MNKTRMKILIVEDEYLIGLVLRQDLIQLGHTVSGPVSTGEKAVEIAVAQPPDLIFIDINLAGALDGIDAAREIRSQVDVPIIFMTGYTDDEMINRTAQVGALACLTKPVPIYEIARVIEQIG